jgi:hypothetical protein
MPFGQHITSILLGSAILALPIGANSETLRFRSDDWLTECDTSHETADGDCSIIGVFRNSSTGGTKGSFSFLIDLRNHQVAVVGEPAPTRATLTVDKNPVLGCTGSPCIFSTSEADIISRQLELGSLALIDVFTAKGVFRSSLSPKGYQAGLAKIMANGQQYRSSSK